MGQIIQSILVANRGEIACRIIRTARQLGIKTIALYAESDAKAQHVQMADEAYGLCGQTAQETYLNQEKVIEIAKSSNAQAIHPGYGFLSENADFAERVEKAGLIFIGPDSETIRKMGDKAHAKRLMASSQVPILPGYEGEDQDDSVLLKEAERIGFPLILKPAAGGGGKGMKIVREASEFLSQLHSGRREAKSSFGDERVIIEKYLSNPRHIEVQIFGDVFGHVIHLFERECTLQRRYQKIIEEAPSVNLPFELREKICQSAVKAAETVNYRGAGTVEFLLDQDHQFYFMEMNTRLQVEHPVTEAITGLDLVAWQIWVAEGKPLQRDLKPHYPKGHAIEARLYAEDPHQNFLPSTGTVSPLRLPSERVDMGIKEGDKITHFFDPMIGKLIVWGEDRNEAIRKLQASLRKMYIGGVKNNITFLEGLFDHPKIKNWEVDVTFIDRYLQELLPEKKPPKKEHWLAALCGILEFCKGDNFSSPWRRMDAFRINLPACQTLTLECEGDKKTFEILYKGQGYVIGSDELKACLEGDIIYFSMNGSQRQYRFYQNSDVFELVIDGFAFKFKETTLLDFSSKDDEGAGHAMAPMTGKVVDIFVGIGDEVKKGKELVILEAMKMEHVIRAHNDGKVTSIHYRIGDVVEEGQELLSIELQKTG